MSSEMTLSEAVEHLDRCSYADGDDVCGRAIQTVRDHARATTPGDRDRGRELAGIADDVRDVLAELGDHTPSGWKRRTLTNVEASLRTLAAPAETEAGDGVLLAAVHRLGGQGRIRAFERSEDGRWFPACLRHWEDPFSDDLGTFETGDAAQLSLVPHILRWHPEWLTEAERLAAAPPAPEGEAGSVEPPELWWHRDHGVLLPTVADGIDYGWHVLGSSTWLDERPSDAVRLAAAPPEGGQG